MANKGKKPIRQTNTANQVKRSPNYNHSNIIGNQKQNYNNMNFNNNMNYNDMNMNMNIIPQMFQKLVKQKIYMGQ